MAALADDESAKGIKTIVSSAYPSLSARNSAKAAIGPSCFVRLVCIAKQSHRTDYESRGNSLLGFTLPIICWNRFIFVSAFDFFHYEMHVRPNDHCQI